MESGELTKPASAVDEFMARVLSDPAAQARLAVPIAVPDYVDIAVGLAAEYGIALAPGDVDARLRPDPSGSGRRGAAPVTFDRWPGAGWLPARSVPNGDAPAFDWAWFGEAPLSEPFFEDSVRRASALPFNRMFRTRTTLASLVADHANHPATAPVGFIFHMSRCGSTLAARMLMAVPGHAVASEPEPLDAVVQWATLSGASQDEQIAALRAIVAALGRERGAGQRRFFIKLDAWHAVALPLFRAAFPDVPWTFLHRDPVEVIVSQLANPGLHFVPGLLPPMLIGIDTSDWTSMADYGARVLARICGAVVEHWSLGGGLLVEYRDLGEAMTSTIPMHFGFRPDADERRRMTAAALVNAKQPSEAFAPDGRTKRSAASIEILAAAAAHLAPITLDMLRRDSIQGISDRDSGKSAGAANT